MKIIGLCGPKGVGKTQTANAIVNSYLGKGIDAQLMSFATPIKHVAKCLFPDIGEYGKEQTMPHANRISPFFKTPRSTYQFIGTELFRNLNKDFWIEIIKLRLDELADDNVEVIVIDDVRFDNEVKFICDFSKASLVYRVTRPGVNYTNEHDSERLTPLQEWLPLINLEVPGAIEQAIGHG